MIALVGPSGAGKTTLCNLVARFYDPVRGQVTLDGRDLRQIDVQSYRRLLGIVEQDVFLFDGTVAQNIAYARRQADREEIERVARMANAHEFIQALDRGYDTVIGERGVRLSGGQRQRLAIARALLADPRVLILDEATSNLDTHSERLIQRSLQALLAGRTSFVIAHRLSTIVRADLILVLEEGRIVERGTHEELLAAGGRYEAMFRLQAGTGESFRTSGPCPRGSTPRPSTRGPAPRPRVSQSPRVPSLPGPSGAARRRPGRRSPARPTMPAGPPNPACPTHPAEAALRRSARPAQRWSGRRPITRTRSGPCRASAAWPDRRPRHGSATR
jgi:ABC-type multidrug transport system ATPase subunit